MTTDILIQALREAFERAVHAAVDARITGILQAHTEAYNQSASQIAALNLQRVNDDDRLNSLLIDVDSLKQRVAALELRMPLNTDLNKIRELIDNKIEEALDAHANTYDHDRYDNVCDDFEGRGNGDIEDAVRDALRGASFSVEVSL